MERYAISRIYVSGRSARAIRHGGGRGRFSAASRPFNRLRIFLCITMTAGFYLAVFLFHTLLQVALPQPLTPGVWAGLTLLSRGTERCLTALIRTWHPRKQKKAGLR